MTIEILHDEKALKIDGEVIKCSDETWSEFIEWVKIKCGKQGINVI